jgi:hypothetical protein
MQVLSLAWLCTKPTFPITDHLISRSCPLCSFVSFVVKGFAFSDPRSSALISGKLLPFAMPLALDGPVMACLLHENKKHA